MANEKSGKETGAPIGSSNQAANQPKIVWDDSNMRSAYANVVNGSYCFESVCCQTSGRFAQQCPEELRVTIWQAGSYCQAA